MRPASVVICLPRISSVRGCRISRARDYFFPFSAGGGSGFGWSRLSRLRLFHFLVLSAPFAEALLDFDIVSDAKFMP